jgi:hypothetical protein
MHSCQLPVASSQSEPITKDPKLETGNWELETNSDFLDRTDLAALVVTAMRADLVRRLRFAALRTGANRHRLQCIMGAPLGGARFGMAAFGIRHD